MKRKILVTTMVVLDDAKPYCGTTIAKCLENTFSESIEVDGWNSCKTLAYTVHEWTKPKHIANELADELSGELDMFITAHKLGDNGDDDVSFELIQHTTDGIKCLCDIAVQRHSGLWHVSIDIDDGLIEVNELKDILDYLGKEVESHDQD